MVAHVWATVCIYVHWYTSVHAAHHRMMCANVTERGSRGYYIMCTKGDLVLSVYSRDGRERFFVSVDRFECTGAF